MSVYSDTVVLLVQASNMMEQEGDTLAVATIAAAIDVVQERLSYDPLNADLERADPSAIR